MPRRKEIENALGIELYSVDVFPGLEFFQHFNPASPFEKWAAVPVSDFSAIPEGMETLVIEAGLYAVFRYKGKSSEAQTFYQMIFQEWLPQSVYRLDDRPHFAVMGLEYKNDDPISEEDIWVPVVGK